MSRSQLCLVVWCAVLVLDGLGLALAPRALNLPAPLAPSITAPSPALTPAHRVALIVVDGLRADTAQQLLGLQALARRGASAVLEDEPPTVSAAQYVSLLTGVPPRDSGVRNNFGIRPVMLDSVPAQVRAAGRRAAEVGDDVDWWYQLFGAAFNSTEVVPPAALSARARALIAESDFLVVHLVGVDLAGHRHGGASVAYAQAARAADETVTGLATQALAQGSAVVVVSDHGHTDGGGHGGEESIVKRTWLVAAGPGIKLSATMTWALASRVAPFLAALLGVPAPASSEEGTLADLLEVDGPTREKLALADAQRKVRVQAALVPARAQLVSATWRARSLRGLALLVLALLVVKALRLPRSAVLPGAMLGLLGLAVSVCACMLGGLSFSAARTTLLGMERFAVLGAIGAVAVAVSCAWWRRRHGDANGVGQIALLVAGAPAALAFVAEGIGAPRLVCEPASIAIAPLAAFAAYLAYPLLGVAWAVNLKRREGKLASR